MPINSPNDIINATGALLVGIAPTTFGEPAEAMHEAPRRYVWTLLESPLGGPMRTINDKGRAVDSAQLRFAVECWGNDFDDAWFMTAALLTALKSAVGGRQYQASQIVPVPDRLTRLGYTLGVLVEMHLHIPAIDLSAYPATTTTAPVESVAEATPATSTPGDGVLEGQET